MQNVYECHWAPFLTQIKKTVRCDKLYNTELYSSTYYLCSLQSSRLTLPALSACFMPQTDVMPYALCCVVCLRPMLCFMLCLGLVLGGMGDIWGVMGIGMCFFRAHKNVFLQASPHALMTLQLKEFMPQNQMSIKILSKI